MQCELIDIPGLEPENQTRWRVRMLAIDRKCLVLPDLVEWQKNSPADFKKIMKVMRYVGQLDQVRDEKHVKKSGNPQHGDVYEMRAHKGSARLMFFYSKRDRAVVICTNTYWKTKDSKSEQDNAFALCARLKALYEGN